MNVTLDYGTTGLNLDLSGLNAHVFKPSYPNPIEDEAAGFSEAINHPIGAQPIREIINSSDRVAIAIPDITRPLPTGRLLGWLFKELSHVPAENFVIISGTGTHRSNTVKEWHAMVGEEIYKNYRCIDHEGANPETLALAGNSSMGYEVIFNKDYVQADKRILMGFIEPHFMAGFSGGYKAAFPGVTAVETIMKYHSAQNIGHDQSTWGVLEGNPTQENIRAGGSVLSADFLINIAQDNQRRITGFFFGDVIEAHEKGCAFCKATAMVACDQLYPVVVTTNSGYPLDQNLYQTVKGISAAAQILEPGGSIIVASRCNDGFPAHGNFRDFLFECESPQAMLDKIHTPGFEKMDQWQVQILAKILKSGSVHLYSELDDEEVRKAHLNPVSDIREAIDQERAIRGADIPIAVLPEGPLTIPYIV